MAIKKISSLGFTAKKALLSGISLISFATLLLIYGQKIPRLGYQLFFWYIFLSALISLFLRWFKPKIARENLWETFAKLLLAMILGNAIWLENTAVYLIVFAIAFYQLFIAFINLVTWWLYRQNKIAGRFRYLFDGLWLALIGTYSMSPFHDVANLGLFFLAVYLFSLGLTRIRDGLFFSSDLRKNHLKRRIRVSLPIFISALVPAVTLDKINAFLQENDGLSANEVYNQTKTDQKPQLELLVHTAETSVFSKIGHVDLCYKGQVISYGNYDPTSERLFGMVGDGILFKCQREKYIDLCKKESHKTLFGYGISLTAQQEAAVEERLAEIDSLLVDWEPSEKLLTDVDGQQDHTYAYKIKTETEGKLYKFSQSKFKTYFVLSTNCVLLADSIVGQAGTDILNPKGFISPGTYQTYLDQEYERPNSLVVSKQIY